MRKASNNTESFKNLNILGAKAHLQKNTHKEMCIYVDPTILENWVDSDNFNIFS